MTSFLISMAMGSGRCGQTTSERKRKLLPQGLRCTLVYLLCSSLQIFMLIKVLDVWFSCFILLSCVKVSELIIPTMETARQMFFLKTYVDHSVPLLFVGPTGTGKTAITNNFLLKLPKEKYIPSFINFSARTSANQTQDIIMSKLDRRRKGLFGPPTGKEAIIFVGETYFSFF